MFFYWKVFFIYFCLFILILWDVIEDTEGCGVVDIVVVGRVGIGTVASSGHTIPFAGTTFNFKKNFL